MEQFVLETAHITLGQLLKRLDIIQTGGQAKWFLQEREVLVNGETESRRGRKLVAGDVVTVDGWGTVSVVAPS
ncbi:S4 domain-containing protein YaaA [Numidum massiliense]|uniref:S4 domain-containing protein YaaA n=1 Tax=Numidum massiliense TaxID=1522315 RepID=UPI0006D59DEA|nr:S4 domain-containing protein YaaA [Numidum massiliense]